MHIIAQVPVQIDEDQLFRRLRIDPADEMADDIRRLAASAGQAARPKALYDEVFIETRGDDYVEARGVRFTSRVLRVNLDKVERFFPFVATCGAELDGLGLPPDDVFGAFVVDSVKEMALAAAIRALAQEIERRFGISKRATMHPGSGDVGVWPIEQQRELFRLLGGVREAIGVTLTDSCLMLPNKTVSGVLYPSEVDFITCALCHRADCPNRRTPFDAELWTRRMAGPHA